MATSNPNNINATPRAPHTDDPLTIYRLAMLEDTMKQVAETLTKMATLDQRVIDAQAAMTGMRSEWSGRDADKESRLRTIELEMPTLKLIRGWVISGVVACAGLLGVTLYQVATVGAKITTITVTAPASTQNR